MNGIHDLGGMHGFGRVEVGEDESVFREPWQGRVFALLAAAHAAGLANPDAFRHGIETLDPVEYLSASYYERWLASLEKLAVASGVVTREDLTARRRALQAGEPPEPARARVRAAPEPAADRPTGYRRETRAAPRFRAGDRVVARNVHPAGHTRLPRYVRGRRGVVVRSHGSFVFPDTNAHGLGENPQPLYSVRFEAGELWGEQAEPRGSVHLDLFEGYLEPEGGRA